MHAQIVKFHKACIAHLEQFNISQNENKNSQLFAPLVFGEFALNYTKKNVINDPEAAAQYVIYCTVFFANCSKQSSTPNAVIFWLKQSIAEAENVYWDKIKFSKIKKLK